MRRLLKKKKQTRKNTKRVTVGTLKDFPRKPLSKFGYVLPKKVRACDSMQDCRSQADSVDRKSDEHIDDLI